MTARAAPAPLGLWPAVLTPRATRGLRGPVFWLVLMPALLAWVWMLAQPGSPHAGHGHMHMPALDIGSWSAMVFAMMFPTLVPMAAHVASRSYRALRTGQVLLFTASYAALWCAAFLLAYPLGVVAQSVLAPIGAAGWIATLGLIVAAFWQLSDAKIRAGWACHLRPPLSAIGRAARIDAVRFGLGHGARCLRSCFLLMVPPMLGAHSVFVMAVITALMLAERATDRPNYQGSAFILLMLAAASALPGL